jgi:hypothetical protein
LRSVLVARNIHESTVHEPFIAGIHALVDFVNHSERYPNQGLKSHQIGNRRNSTFLWNKRTESARHLSLKSSTKTQTHPS